MNLFVKIKPDFNGSVSIIDYTRETEEYLPDNTEAVLPRYYNFKYSDTCTINMIKYISSKGEELFKPIFTEHTAETDSIRFKLPKDGYYYIQHIVIPTVEWYNKVKDEDLSEYNIIYVTDGHNLYRVHEGELVPAKLIELIEVNPYKTTISIMNYRMFSIDKLKHCFVNIAKQIFSKYVGNCNGKCHAIDDTLKFNRDFIWMTLHVLGYYLEWDKYMEAQLLLEDLACYNFCDETLNFKSGASSCGCRK